MNMIDLFSGIGGFSLAAHALGIKTVQFVELDSYCQAVLRKNFSNTPIWGDIKTFQHETITEPINIICGGFPCQPFSIAGKMRGGGGL